ncbi:hypothetical protein SteCoe_28156 [Stentor coeruleus]|uniref:Helicase ATP-binding domain-containing protein n=1 Tax=Stentor coeruleus TaxID=5963 RepID=A0A1R2B8V1_9CILI|nr:hypothetical protein SteCoe_28156 [Stentor coeruleus]
MNDLYDCLHTCQGGIFESPTGTGKSLSIICASLTFLTDICSQSLNDLHTLSTPRDRIFRHDYTGMSIPAMKHETSKALLDLAANPKILYLSRTHSQLDQFVGEIKKTKWANTEKVRVVRLGSRSQLCLNEEVKSQKGLVEFKCKELVKHKDEEETKISDEENSQPGYNMVFKNHIQKYLESKKKIAKCPFYSEKELLRVHLLGNVCDIEDLITSGTRMKSCPYFATRSAIADADIILAPYSSILNKHNRHSIGISLESCYVIIDESHNLIDAITDYHSAAITKSQILACQKCFRDYYNLFVEKMFPRKRMFVEMALRVIDGFLSYINRHEILNKKVDSRERFLEESKLSDIDFFGMWDYFEEEDLTAKVYQHGPKSKETSKFNLYSMKAFADFILSMNEPDANILIFKDPEASQVNMKFLLLNPYNKFKKLLEESKCVVLAGGTLTPKEEFLKLFKGLPSNRLKNFSCGHVIPKENLMFSIIPSSSTGREFRFTFDTRDDIRMFQELAYVLVDISKVVPNGIVVFLPSYGFLKKIQDCFDEEIMKLLNQRKKVFFDSKDESMLKEYCECAERTGAILFAVVRGSLSEGINFSNKLGRCVIVIGMPYLNKNDLEVEVKMNYYNRLPDYSGNQFYENACHIAINQSIGRVIRHVKDFAIIILIDSRHEKSYNRRPDWIKRSYIKHDSLGGMLNSIRSFFRSKINAAN